MAGTDVTTAEDRAVVQALRTFKRQADDCVAALYAYLTIHTVAGASRPIREHVNENALFWNIALHALQSALILALGRVFEHNTPHNIHTFMQVTSDNRIAFLRVALGRRKAAIFDRDPEGLKSYIREARSPRPGDFSRVAARVREHRKAYLASYRVLRHHVFAHTLTTDPDEIADLFSKTNIRQLQRMTTYLGTLHDAFWEAFHNGGRLTLRRRRHSVARMLRRPKVGRW